nr:hypothetical protein [Nocardiopsis listeri]
MVGGRARDVDQVTAGGRAQAVDERPGDIDEGCDVEGQQGLHPFGVLIGESPVRADARVVDQAGHTEATAVHLGRQRSSGPREPEIGGHGLDPDAVRLTQFGGQGVQSFGPAGDEDQVAAAFGEPARQGGTDPGACAGDERGLGSVVDNHDDTIRLK